MPRTPTGGPRVGCVRTGGAIIEANERPFAPPLDAAACAPARLATVSCLSKAAAVASECPRACCCGMRRMDIMSCERCIHVYTSTNVNTCLYTFTHVHTYIYTSTHVNTRIHTRISCIYTCNYTPKYIYRTGFPRTWCGEIRRIDVFVVSTVRDQEHTYLVSALCMYIHTYTHIYTNINMYVSWECCMRVHTYIHIHIHTQD